MLKEKYLNVLFTCTICQFQTNEKNTIKKHKCIFPHLRNNDSSINYATLLGIECMKTKYYEELLNRIGYRIDKIIFPCSMDGFSLPNQINDTQKKVKKEIKSKKKVKEKLCLNKKKSPNIIFEKENKRKTDKTIKEIKEIKEITAKKEEGNIKDIKEVEEGIKEVEDAEEIEKEEVEEIEISETERKINDLNSYFNSFLQNKSRLYLKSLLDLKYKRNNILPLVKYSEYNNILKSQIKELDAYFKEKNIPDKKLHDTISQTLSPIETRLLLYPGYWNHQLDGDDLERLELSLDNEISRNTEYSPFIVKDLLCRLNNYSSCVTPLHKTLERCLIDKNGFESVVYYKTKKSTDEVPYSFYILESISKNGLKIWNMDCRMDNLASQIMLHLTPYFISVFKKIYLDLFHDNTYRKNFKNNVMEFELEQILQNLCVLSVKKKMCITLMKIVKNNSTYTSTQKDKFNITSDDMFHRKKFLSEYDFREDLRSLFKNLFDEIEGDALADLVERYISITDRIL